MRPSRPLRLAAVIAAGPVLIAPVAAQAQTQLTPDMALAQITQALSLISSGMIAATDRTGQVTQQGDAYHVRYPLPNMMQPPDAAVDVVARPLDGGVWDIQSVTVPPSGSLALAAPAQSGGVAASPTPAATVPGVMTYSITQQNIHGKIDPTLTVPSPYTLELGGVTVHLALGNKPPMEHTIEHFISNGTLSSDASHRTNMDAQASGTNWQVNWRNNPQTPFALSIRSVAARYEVTGLDRARAEQIRAATQTLSRLRQAAGNPPPGQPQRLTPEMRAQLRTIVDNSNGLLTHLSFEEVMDRLHYDAGNTAGDVGRVRVGLSSDVRNGLLSADFTLGLENLQLGGIPPSYVSYVPTHIDIRPAVSGVQVEAVSRLLHDATAEGGNPATLESEGLTLLNEPGAKVGIESLSIDAGPLHMDGSARLRAMPDGTVGADIHLSARGVDALMASVQANPGAQQVMPMLFMAKGMGKPDGDSLVWDISLADGVTLVNGVPFGAPRPARPPAR